MVFGPFVLNRVIYPKLRPKMKGVILNRVGVFGLFLVLNRVRVSNPQRQPYTQTWVECHQKLWGLLNQGFEKSGFHCNLTDGKPIWGNPSCNIKSIPTTHLANFKLLVGWLPELYCTQSNHHCILPIGYIQLCCSMCKFIEITSLFFMAFSFIFNSDNETWEEGMIMMVLNETHQYCLHLTDHLFFTILLLNLLFGG